MLEQVITELTEAVKALNATLTNSSSYPAPAEEEKPEPKRTRKSKKEELKDSVDVVSLEELRRPEVTEEFKEELKAEVEEVGKEYSIDEVRKRLQPYVQENGPSKVQEALKELGAENLSSLDPAKLPLLLGKVFGD